MTCVGIGCINMTRVCMDCISMKCVGMDCNEILNLQYNHTETNYYLCFSTKTLRGI